MPPLNRKPDYSRRVFYGPSRLSPETKRLLKGCYLSQRTVRALRAMKPHRQVETARVIAEQGTCADIIVMPLLAATKPRDLCESRVPQRWVTLLKSEWDRASGGDIDGLTQRLEDAEARAAHEDLDLAVTRAWVRRLLANDRIHDLLVRRHAEALAVLQSALARK